MDSWLYKYCKSYVCFIFVIPLLIILLILNYDYVDYKMIALSDVNDLEVVSGSIDKIYKSKTYDIYVNDFKLFTNKKHDISEGDIVTIYYYYDSFRDHNNIVEIRSENTIIYSHNDFIKDNNYQVYYYIIIGLVFGNLFLITLGLILLKYPYGDNTLSYIMKYAKKYNMNNNDIEKVKEELIPYYKDNKINVNKEELIIKFNNSLVFKDNKYITNAMEYIENDYCNNILNEVIFNILENNEIRLYYDSTSDELDACFFYYKYNNKLVSIYMFNEDNNKYLIDESCMYFSYPKESKMNVVEKNMFIKDLKQYCSYNDDIIINIK